MSQWNHVSKTLDKPQPCAGQAFRGHWALACVKVAQNGGSRAQSGRRNALIPNRYGEYGDRLNGVRQPLQDTR
jgi:hypothetical protein